MLEKKMKSFHFFEHRKVIFYVILLAILLVVLSSFTFIDLRIDDYVNPESILISFLGNKTSQTSSKGKNNSSNDGDDNSNPLSLVSLDNSTVVTDNLKSSISQQVIHHNFNYSQGQRNGRCYFDRALLKVYMYDLPPKFHFGMLGWKGGGNKTWPDIGDVNSIPRYPGGLNLQHSVEYWLTLDLLSSNLPGATMPCAAVRVMNSSLADVFFVPFFSSLSYNRHSKLHGKDKISKNNLLQGELVQYLTNQEAWKRAGGKDHLVLAHHPNSMLEARKKLSSAILVLSDFGRYAPADANLRKDIIAPYRHVVDSLGNDSPPFEARHILAYFQGAIVRKDGGAIRQKLYLLLKDEKDCHFSFGSARQNGIKQSSKGMALSKFCLNIAGDTPSSNRLFDAIVSHCVPVIISDNIELPYEDVLDYSEFCVFIRASDAVKKGFVINLLRRVTLDEWTIMWQRLKQVAHHFEYQYPSKRGDAVQMIWEAVHRKISSVNQETNKRSRFYRTQFDS